MAQKSRILGLVTVTLAGTRVQVTSSSIGCGGIIFQASSSNSGKVYIGDSTVTSSNGIALGPGESFTVAGHSLDGNMDSELILSDYWVDADTNGNSVRVHYLGVRA